MTLTSVLCLLRSVSDILIDLYPTALTGGQFLLQQLRTELHKNKTHFNSAFITSVTRLTLILMLLFTD